MRPGWCNVNRLQLRNAAKPGRQQGQDIIMFLGAVSTGRRGRASGRVRLRHCPIFWSRSILIAAASPLRAGGFKHDRKATRKIDAMQRPVMNQAVPRPKPGKAGYP